MAEENTDLLLAGEVSGDEVSQDECFDIPVIAVAKISEPEDIIEESIDIPLAVEVSKEEGSQDESFDILPTAEINEPENCNVEVIVDINSPKIRPKIPSRYLSPHVSSCHDFCKYGRKALERKPANSVLRKVKSVRGDSQDLRRIIVSLAKQNKDANVPKSSLDYNAINVTDSKEDVISSPEIVTQSPKRLLPSIKEVQAAAVHYSRTPLNLSLTKVSSFTGQGGSGSGTKRNKEVRKGKEQDGDGGSSSSCTNSKSKFKEKNISSEEDIKALVPRAVSWTPSGRVKRVAIANKKIIGRRGLKKQSHPIKSKPDPSNNEEVEEKTLYMIEPSTKNEAEKLTQNCVHTTELSHPQSSSATDDSSKHEKEAEDTPIVPQVSMKKHVKRVRNGTGSKSLSTSSSVSSVFKSTRVESLGAQSTPSSPSSSTCPSVPVHGRPTSRNDVKKRENSKVEHKIKIRRKTQTDSENGDCQSRKLKFRKGRTVELQTETITPRRLKFRRVPFPSETQSPKSDSRKRIIRRKEANQNGDEVKEAENKKSYRRKETMDGKFVSSRMKSERVILRHHQVSKGKKEIQNLFNNVIEETASKLAQTRKSKVKALVGAFETVISLQDTRPSATAVA